MTLERRAATAAALLTAIVAPAVWGCGTRDGADAAESQLEAGLPHPSDGGAYEPSPDGESPPFGDGGKGVDASFAACATDTVTGSRVPLDLYVMLDGSGSMSEATSGGATKWQAVSDALSTFFHASTSKGISVAIQFFPLMNKGVPDSCTKMAQCGSFGPCTRRICAQTGAATYCDDDSDCSGGYCIDYGECTDGSALCAVGAPCASGAPCAMFTAGTCLAAESCTKSRYAAPAVQLSPLPATASALDALLDAHPLRGSTPTGPALAGALDGARALHKAAKSHSTAVLMVTDGLPTTCTPSVTSAIGSIAATGLKDGIRTYVVGVFSPAEETEAKSNLDVIAKSGGTKSAFMAATNTNVSTQLQKALSSIRGTAMACDYALPKPKAGTLDFDKVNVELKTKGGTIALARVKDSGSCGDDEAWYYDQDPSTGTPDRIELCSASCDDVKADSTAAIDLVLGCTSVVK